MKSEDTIYENENTTLDDTQTKAQENQSENKEQAANKPDGTKKSTVRRVAIGSGSGLLLGSLAAMGFTTIANAEETNDGHSDHTGQAAQNYADDSVGISSSVSDDMSFPEAFAAAREDVGPGGAFEWHGNVYSTYTAEEWENMTPEEREEYGDHFSWNQHQNASTAEEQTTEEVTDEEQTVEPVEEPVEGNPEEGTADETNAEEVTPADEVEDQSEEPAVTEEEIQVTVADENPEVEVLGLVHDDETGMDVGGAVIDGQEVFVIDVDNDGVADAMFADLDNDGQISEAEIADISSEGIGMQTFDTSMNDDLMLASNDGETDYIEDSMV